MSTLGEGLLRVCAGFVRDVFNLGEGLLRDCSSLVRDFTFIEGIRPKKKPPPYEFS